MFNEHRCHKITQPIIQGVDTVPPNESEDFCYVYILIFALKNSVISIDPSIVVPDIDTKSQNFHLQILTPFNWNMTHIVKKP